MITATEVSGHGWRHITLSGSKKDVALARDTLEEIGFQEFNSSKSNSHSVVLVWFVACLSENDLEEIQKIVDEKNKAKKKRKSTHGLV